MNPTRFLRRCLPALALAALTGVVAGCNITIGCPEGEVCEGEPNDIRADATLIDFGTPASGDIGGLDTDVFELTVATTSDLKLQTLDWRGAANCLNLWIHMELTDSFGTVLAEDSGSGEGFCPTIDPEDTAAARALSPGTYFVRLTWAGDSESHYSYRLMAQRVAACGDGVVAGSEQCDDGNVTDGDGCAQTCTGEATPEVEPNDTAAQAMALTPPAVARATFRDGNDVDYYRFTLAAPSAVIIMTTDWKGDDWCFDVDTAVELRTGEGVLIASNDDVQGGYCSLISPNIQAAVRTLPAGNYVIFVRQYFTATDGYLLSVSTYPPPP